MAEHWKAKLREACTAISAEMHRRFRFRHHVTKSNANAYAVIGSDGVYEVHAMDPAGYIGLVVFLHEVGHVASNDCSPSRKTDLFRETAAWGFAKSVMAEYGLAWVPSVSNHARACLTSHIKVATEKIEPGGTPAAIVAALKKLDQIGI